MPRRVTTHPGPVVTRVATVDQALLDEFLAECGLSGPFRVDVGQKGDAATRVIELRQPFLVIGRRAGSDLLLDHWQVSRRHAYLQLIEGRFFGVDLGSRTGTHGGDATERSGWLEPGRAIQIGPYLVRPSLPTVAGRDYPPLPVVTWTINGPGDETSYWTMNRGLALIGRSPACKVRLADPEVSRFHASLVLTTGGVWAVDLLSQRPMLLNGQPVRFARVEPGDELQIGRHALVPDYDPSQIHPLPRRHAAGFDDMPTIAGDDGPGSSDMLPALKPTVMVPSGAWDRPGSSFALADGTALRASDPGVQALVQQFGAMQQQMFDQFHQTMMMMFEGFAALHRETSGSIRQEFEEVRKLSREIESLREETARLAEATTMSLQEPAFFKAAEASAGALPRNGHAPPTPPGPAGPRPEPPPKMAAPLPDPHVDIHAQLCERLNSIQSERQTRWQKILGMMATRA